MKISMKFSLWQVLKSDADAAGLITSTQVLKALVLNAGYLCTVLYRLQSWFTKPYLIHLAKFISRLNLILNGSDFVIGSKIGPGMRITHPFGIVVGNKVIAGHSLKLMQNVTIGQKGFNSSSEEDTANPIIGDNVSIGANSVLIGGISVGSNCVIGAGTVLTKNAPSGCKVYGNPAIFF